MNGGSPPNSPVKQTPQMQPKTPINFFKNVITINKSMTFVNIFPNIFLPILAKNIIKPYLKTSYEENNSSLKT